MERIALFLPSLRGGGAERVMVNLARGFSARGHRVDLVLAKAEGPYLSDVPETVRMVDLAAPRVIHSLPGLRNYLTKERPVALLSALNHANVVALWARRLSRVPVRLVISVHNPVSVVSRHARSLRGRLGPLWFRAFFPWADGVVAVSRAVGDDLSRTTGLPREKIDVIHNPIVTPELLSRGNEVLDHPWFHPHQQPVVVGVGRLTEAKDFPTLLHAFSIVRKHRAVRLMILGEGEERSRLERLVEDLGLQESVALPGFVDNPYKYMKRARLFVLSSKWEGFGNVLVEAMAVGTPVVSTNPRGGPREILANGRWGRLVPVGDSLALADAISDELNGEKLGRAVQRRAADFSLEAITGQYADVMGLCDG